MPKLSRICIGQNPYSSSQIWTADKKPPGWPSENGIKWKDPNNNPKDSLEVLQKKMSVLLEMCKTKNIPVEYQREIKAYLNVCEDLKSNDTPDISSLQILRQQRKKSHELALACRHFSEMVKWHGAPERSTFLENELINLCLVLQKANADRMLNAQFEEVYCAIAQAEVMWIGHKYCEIISICGAKFCELSRLHSFVGIYFPDIGFCLGICTLKHHVNWIFHCGLKLVRKEYLRNG